MNETTDSNIYASPAIWGDDPTVILLKIAWQLRYGMMITPQAFMAYLASLPTSDPHIVNAPWNNGGVLTISAG